MIYQTFDDDFYRQLSESFWSTIGVDCGGYNMAIDEDIINVLKLMAKEYIYLDDIAKQLGLDVKYVELIQYILCSTWICEYGTSPRGCWLDHKIDKEKFLIALEIHMDTWK